MEVLEVVEVVNIEGELFLWGFLFWHGGVVGEVPLLQFDTFGADEFFLVYMFYELHLSYDIYNEWVWIPLVFENQI